MARARVGLEWDQTSLLWWTIAETNRDPQGSEPLDPLMFHPLHSKPEEDNGAPDLALWHRVTRNANVVKIDHAKLRSNTGRQGVHQTDDQRQ